MTDLLDEAKRLLAAATPGPWTHEKHTHPCHSDWVSHANGEISDRVWARGDAALIARAPTLIAELVAMVEAERRFSSSMRKGEIRERARIVEMLRGRRDAAWRGGNPYDTSGDESRTKIGDAIDAIADELERGDG